VVVVVVVVVVVIIIIIIIIYNDKKCPYHKIYLSVSSERKQRVEKPADVTGRPF
jgi:hypothetical protein